MASFATAASAELRQATTAAVRGVVIDQLGAALPAAAVSVVNIDTGGRRSMPSRADGSFQFVSLAPGRYRLAVSRAGFEAAERDIELSIDQVLIAPVRLSLSRQTAAVTVSAADVPLVDFSKTAIGRTIAARELEALPLNVTLTRDFMALATLTPGIAMDVSNTAGVAANGQGQVNNTILVDGLSHDEVGFGLPVDALSAFKVVSGQFSAEFGQASGAVINVLTRSGTNRPTGRLSWFRQEGAWNATSPVAHRAGVDDPGLRQTSVSGFWGGPLIRDQIFLFAAGELGDRRTFYINSSPVATIFRPDDPLTIPFKIRVPRLSVRGDANMSRSNTLALRYGFTRSTNGEAIREAQSTMERGKSLVNPVHYGSLRDTHVLGSSAVHEVRLLWSQDLFKWSVDGFCPGCAALNYQNILMGKPGGAPVATDTQRVDVVDTITWMVSGRSGRHTIKAGVDASRSSNYNASHGNRVGTYAFRHDLLFDPTDRRTYPREFTQNCRAANVSLDSPTFCEPYAAGPAGPLRQTIVAVFLQDEWQPHARLSVNFGVRWDHTGWPGPSGPRNDVASRLGVAIRPSANGAMAIRAGLGRFYDERALAFAVQGELGLVQLTITNPGFQGDARRFDPYGFNPNGPPVAQYSINQYATTSTPYTDQASIGIQHQFGRHVGLTVDVVRARGHRLPIRMDLNRPHPVTHVRPDPDPRLKQIIVTETRAESWYTGLLIGVQTRPWRAQTYAAAYTWSSAENNTDGANAFPRDQTNLLDDRGPVLNDARHRLTASAAAALPFAFSLGVVVTARTALPYNVTLPIDLNQDGVTGNDRPDGMSRNAARGSAFVQANVRLAKMVGHGARRLELLIEATNVMNRANWIDYNGRLDAAGNATASTGTARGADVPRQVQIGARFSF